MTYTRTQYRAAVGNALGRRYYVASTTTGTSTTTEILDSTRIEAAKEWDGSAIYFTAATAPKSAIVTGGARGRLYLDSALGSIPANGAAYELTKGFTIDDYNLALDWAFSEVYPQFYLPIDDTATVTTSTSAIRYNLAATWVEVTKVRRQVANSSPTSYEDLVEDDDYTLWQGASNLVLELSATPTQALTLHFIGKALATLGSADSATATAPLQLILPGALQYLYEKGTNADETAFSARFEREAAAAAQKFEAAKQRYAIRTNPRPARFPRVEIENLGNNVEFD